MAYKDYTDTKSETDNLEDKPDALFYSRPLILPGTAFGALNFFFDPTEIEPEEIESLGKMIASYLDEYWQTKEKKSRVTN